MTTRSICWGLLGASLALGQIVPPPQGRGNKTLEERLGDLSRKLTRSQEPYQKKVRLDRKARPEVCAAPLLEVRVSPEEAKQWTMRVVKPREPLPRMPQLAPPAPACPSPGQ